MKKMVVCADDYGQNPTISSVIRELAEKRRITAISCMTNSYFWPNEAKKLLSLQDNIDIGLHLNLTEGKALSHFDTEKKELLSLKKLLLNTFTKKYTATRLEEELTAQFEQFTLEMGREPDFIDGHQHIHHLPQVREALLALYQKKNLGKKTVYIRSVAINNWKQSFKQGYLLKRSIIHLTGATALQKELKKAGILYNPHFAGVYNFQQAKNYPNIFQQILKNCADKTLIMCHPGQQDNQAFDAIADSRMHEFSYLSSSLFIEDCKKFNIQLTRFQDIV